jgi:hypothetical protein
MEHKNSTTKSNEPAGPSDHLELEFPDWTGMDDSSTRITPEAAFRLCELYPLLLPKSDRDNGSKKCVVEFIL